MATLGIIGGIAPESTVDYYRLLVERYREAHPDGAYPTLVINSIDLTRFLRLVEAGERERLVQYLVGEVDRLAKAGTDVGLFASNTPHLVFDEVSAGSSIPLLSIVEATARAARAQHLGHLGLLGTRFTMDGDFYPKVFNRFGLRVTAPRDADRAWVHDVYVSELVNGNFRAETRRAMQDVIARLRDDAGIDGVVLGGTELPLLLRDQEVADVPLLDTTSAHVDEAVASLLARERE